MNRNCIRINWLIPVLGIAMAAGGFMAAATYLNCEREIRSAEDSMATIKGLHKDLQLCEALRTIHEGDPDLAARRLDLILCEDIVAVNAKLASADPLERAFIRNAFARFALVRPKSALLLADASQELRSDQVEAERILAEAGTGVTPLDAAVAIVP